MARKPALPPDVAEDVAAVAADNNLSLDCVASLVDALAAITRDVQTGERATVAGYFPAVVRGAAEELQRRRMKPTPERLEAVLTANGVNGPGAWVVWDLMQTLADMRLDREATNEAARERGREAVRAAIKEAAHGNQG